MNDATARQTDASGNPIYRFPEENLPKLRERIEKLNRRAKRLGMEPLAFAELGQEFVTLQKRLDQTEEEMMIGRPGKVIEYQVRFVLATVVGACPRVNGWDFAATINHEDGGNILRVAPGFEITLPLRYRTAGTGCEHCKTDRRRNDTYVLRSDSGEWKQVGRSCLADFLRCESPAAMAEWAETIAGLAGEVGMYEDEMGGGGRRENYFGLPQLLAQVACCVRSDGWCSRTEARNSMGSKLASVDQALSWFDDKFVAKQRADVQARYSTTEADKKRAVDAIAWAQELPADVTNDYLWNLRVVSHKEAVKGRDAGLAGSIIVAHQKHLEKELTRKYERDNPSEFFGVLGERGVFTLSVTGTRELESEWGCTTVVQFRDAAGNRAVWFASDPAIPLDLDTPLTVKATVKKHETYNERKQTILSRVALHVDKPLRKRRAKPPVAEMAPAPELHT